jgi:hypothetical protein
MNVEIKEMQAVEEAAKTDDSFELLALDDLDLVAGGNAIGNLL